MAQGRHRVYYRGPHLDCRDWLSIESDNVLLQLYNGHLPLWRDIEETGETVPIEGRILKPKSESDAYSW
jgi:hypothetical protein